MQIFTGKFRLPVRALNQPDVFATEDWRSLHLDIQVRTSSFLLVPRYLHGCPGD